MGVELNAASELGDAIRRARVAADLTQSELGEFCGRVDRHVIAAIERGAVTTQVRRLFDLLDVLGLDIQVRPRTHRLAVTVSGYSVSTWPVPCRSSLMAAQSRSAATTNRCRSAT